MRKERAPGPYKGVARAGTSPGTDWPRAPPDHQLTTGTSKGGKGPSPRERDYEQDGRGIHIFIVNPVYVSKLNLTATICMLLRPTYNVYIFIFVLLYIDINYENYYTHMSVHQDRQDNFILIM